MAYLFKVELGYEVTEFRDAIITKYNIADEVLKHLNLLLD